MSNKLLNLNVIYIFVFVGSFLGVVMGYLCGGVKFLESLFMVMDFCGLFCIWIFSGNVFVFC